jgi:hypothetical protein
VGAMARNRPSYIHVKSASYDWIGLDRIWLNGFDSR